MAILREVDAGVAVPEVCRKYSISGNAFYNWMKKYDGMGISELGKLRRLSDANKHFKK